MTEPGLTYAGAGVSFSAKEETTDRLKRILQSTYRPEVLSEVGHFGGLFALGNYDEPVLVSSTDSVGTKLKIAFMTGRHGSVGFDIVAHCANDILVQGAKPLFFLDYIGTSKLNPDVVEQIVDGLAAGCREIGCALIGGETAELPEFYREGEYDLVGTIVGVVERSGVITGDEIHPGDQLIGLPSLGLHTNGFSLARRILLDVCGYNHDDYIPEFGMTLGEELLKNHKCYVSPILKLRKHCGIKGMAHITGGGLPGNLVRILPPNRSAIVYKSRWAIPPIFGLLQEKGHVESDEMYRVFNMGIGLVLVVSRVQADAAVDMLSESGESPFRIGEIVEGKTQVQLVEKG
ncbi:MAG: phosphoribosylformylglycinamidine cyclo-ligase [Candidatus Poribacteria bacterium]|nr:phosphoribosylformylglycinamidine cyclo-ligase [Candidatus Poribacteria bacterium]MDE0505081.1 phosphoribosylformylglycinamidine cyclo-ligase [Candidatus Poribacteria bacterium]